MRSVLIIEDNPAMLRGLEDNFASKGYNVKTAMDGEQGLNAAVAEKPDLVILDISIPKINGYEVCSLIRRKNLDMHIMMLTAKAEEKDIILGLSLGADDYITKPFNIKVLLAKAEALQRRRNGGAQIYEFGNCLLNMADCTLLRSGRKVALTPEEFKMLHLFLRRPGDILTREEILSTVWGYCHFITLRDVDRLVNTLRGKVEPDPNVPVYIHNERTGYRFERPKPDGNSTDN